METRARCRPPLVGSGKRKEEGPPLNWTQHNFSERKLDFSILLQFNVIKFTCFAEGCFIQRRQKKAAPLTRVR